MLPAAWRASGRGRLLNPGYRELRTQDSFAIAFIQFFLGPLDHTG
jgi:hypothetical protein